MRIATLSAIEFFQRAARSERRAEFGRPSSLDRLARLISLPVEEFVSQLGAAQGGPVPSWGVLEPGELAGLTVPSLFEDICRHRFPWPRLRLVKEGVHLRPADFLLTIRNRREGVEVIPRGPELADAIRNGATLILDGLEQFNTACGALADDVSFVFGVTPSVNVYLTPPLQVGFGVHCDDHDVLVLQLAGSKEWDLWAPSGVSTDGEPTPPDGPPEYRVTLEHPAWAWVPRGWWHAPRARADGFSLHLSVAVDRMTVRDAVADCIAADNRRPLDAPLRFFSWAHVSDPGLGTLEQMGLAPLWRDATAATCPVIPDPFGTGSGSAYSSTWRRPVVIWSDTSGALWTAIGGYIIELEAPDVSVLETLTSGSTVERCGANDQLLSMLEDHALVRDVSIEC